MDAALHEEWPVRRLARVSAVVEVHFARSFKEAFGVPPHRYLLARRVERPSAERCADAGRATSAARDRESQGVDGRRRNRPSGEGRAAFAVAEGSATTTAKALPASAFAERIGPNILSTLHWTRLLDGELFASSSRPDWALLIVLLQARRPIGRRVRLLASRFLEERRSLLTHLVSGGSLPLLPFEIDTTGGAVG
jgi:hypothetical protein